MDTVWKPKYICLGVCLDRYMYILGALFKLKCKGRLDDVKAYSSVGIGSVISLLMIIGYDPLRIMTVLSDGKVFVDPVNISKNSTMTKAHKTIYDMVEAKMKNIPTLEELYASTGIELYMSAYNITQRKTEIISRITHPKISCITAVLLSYGLAFGESISTYEDKEYIDGTFSDPVPISPFLLDRRDGDVISFSAEINELEINKSDTHPQVKMMNITLSALKNAILTSVDGRCFHISYISPFKIGYLSPSNKAHMVVAGIKGIETFISRMDVKDKIARQMYIPHNI